MVIKKIIKFIDIIKKKPLRGKSLVVVGVLAKSTLTGRQKVSSLKKIGKDKRDGKNICRVKNINRYFK